MGDQLTVGRVIGGLQTYDFRLERVLVLMDVFDQVELRGGGADDEDLGRIVEGAANITKKMMGVVGVLPVAILVDLLALGMAVNVTMRRFYRRLVEGFGQHMENARLVVIDPHCNSTKVHGAPFILIVPAGQRRKAPAHKRRTVTASPACLTSDPPACAGSAPMASLSRAT